MEFQVIKASGEVVPFDPDKLRASLRRAGASLQEIEEIFSEIIGALHGTMPTERLHHMAFKLLRRRSKAFAARYRLKDAIMELGPTGFPFERFVARLLQQEGHEVQVGRIFQGRCVDHEVDVSASHAGRRLMVECKYHNQRGTICHVQTPLYVQARFKDLEQASGPTAPGTGFDQGWLVTNTRFSDDALRYGGCAGLYLMSWDHPRRDGLKERVDRSGLYPITCLSALSKAEKHRLIEQDVMLVNEVLNDPRSLSRAGVRADRLGAVLQEASQMHPSPIVPSEGPVDTHARPSIEHGIRSKQRPDR